MSVTHNSDRQLDIQPNRGNFEKALNRLIQTLNDGSPEHKAILYQWDKDRGNSWYTGIEYLPRRQIMKSITQLFMFVLLCLWAVHRPRRQGGSMVVIKITMWTLLVFAWVGWIYLITHEQRRIFKRKHIQDPIKIVIEEPVIEDEEIKHE